ncbi:MAG: transposase [Fibrobacteria bacterium]|nr:transposase [Fibrobacteria bacterium]
MEDKARSGRRTYDSGFKERAVAMAAESNNVAETTRQLGVGCSLLNSWRNAAGVCAGGLCHLFKPD